jgi:hypothetical protein
MRMPADAGVSIEDDPPAMTLHMTLTRPEHVWAMIDVVESFIPMLPPMRPGKPDTRNPLARLPAHSWINAYEDPFAVAFWICISRREDAAVLFEALSQFISLERERS